MAGMPAQLFASQHFMRSGVARLALVLAGYVVAFGIALAVVVAYVAATDGPDVQASSGMHAFGESLLFLAVFGLSAIPATMAALFFLRPYRTFWYVAAVLALGITATVIIALINYLLPGNVNTAPGIWSTLAPLRILLAPLCVIAFFLSGLFAPIRVCRRIFLGAAGIEAVAFVSVIFVWLQPFR
jgi:hypothetical protein